MNVPERVVYKLGVMVLNCLHGHGRRSVGGQGDMSLLLFEGEGTPCVLSPYLFGSRHCLLKTFLFGL